jgi:hypothetical protein
MSNTIDFTRPAHGIRPMLQGIVGAASRRGQAPLAPLAVRLSAPAGAITVGTMRAVIGASDALQRHLSNPATGSVTTAELARPRGVLAELLHRYQTASRQCVREWLQDPRPIVWLVEAASGRILDTTSEPVADGGSVEEHMLAALADVQPLHGLRERHTRGGIGVPVVLSRREGPAPRRAQALDALAVLARTAVVGVERGFDARVRSVRVRLYDPDAVGIVRLRGAELPLGADWTAAVAFLLGRERRPLVQAQIDGAGTARASCDGFTPLTPAGTGRTPLVLIEGAGLSPLMMAQVANQIVGDAALRECYAVWLYRFPMTAPLFQSAGRLRVDLERFCRRLDANGDGRTAGAVVLAQGPSAVLARTLLVDSGDTLWDAVFANASDAAPLAARDLGLLESMLRWRRSPRVARLIAVNLPDNLGALAAGVGERAVQSTLQLPQRLRTMLERLHAATARHLRPPEPGPARYTEPLHEAVYAAAVAADRALLGLLAGPVLTSGAVLYDAAGGNAPVESLEAQDGAPLGPQALRQVRAWLRRPNPARDARC